MEGFFASLGRQLWDAVRIGGRNISDGIKEAIDFTPLFHIRIGALDIPVTDAIISIVLSVSVLFVLGLILHRPKLRPDAKQSALEIAVLALLGLCQDQGLNRDQAERLLPWTFSMALFITCTNLVSVIKLRPASKTPVFPVTLALMTILYVIFMGMRFVGIKGFFYSLISPMPALVPFNLLDYVIKPLSLAFRLFGNIFGAFILIEFISLVVPLVVPTALGLWFDVGDGIIQGVIFTFLTINYVGEIVSKASEMEEHLKQKREAKKKALSNGVSEKAASI